MSFFSKKSLITRLEKALVEFEQSSNSQVVSAMQKLHVILGKIVEWDVVEIAVFIKAAF